ncbi:PAB1-binding protein 1 [Cyphellophora attinorum]|uniref:PAB1-binding protein 1 n=1 Tax=Cyphellophora attinorum TaxID=1664694 RepID=A0A0N0NQW7_9EURO|nr:PAB1-binding protein 1 [Phialophora attinorum]KPI44398.1 PAB1-binding protein 1 [Phialophora attinorum]
MSTSAGLVPSGATASQSPATPGGQNNTARSGMRSNTAAKNGDSTKRQSSNDPSNRRTPTQKAWTGGSNPLTGRPSSNQTNGVAHAPRSSPGPRTPTQKDGGLSDRHAHDRTLYLLGGAVGCSVLLTLKSGERFDGLFAGSSLQGAVTKITLKMTKKLPQTSQGTVANHEAAFTGSSPDYAMTFEMRDMADLQIRSFTAPQAAKAANGTSSKFQTDTDISGNQLRGERTLQKWVPDASDDADFSLESGKTGEWDQFKANQQLFGTQSSYDESYYTTNLDRSSDSYRQREARANRIAREIESSQSNLQHVREERGQVSQAETEDEEAKYSGVQRDTSTKGFPPLPKGGLDKYTPPARRAPTAAPTVPGAPYDTAILSAQLQRPDSKPATQVQPRQPSPLGQSHVSPAATSTDGPAGAAKPGSGKESQQTTADGADAIMPRLLTDYHTFAEIEKQKVLDKKRAQALEEKKAKLNELMQFSKGFKLKTIVPQDLVGILAKDPAKQEAIVQKSKEDVNSPTATPQAAPVKELPTIRKADIAQIPPFQGGRGRGLPPSASMRLPQQNAMPIRGANGQRPGKVDRPQVVPAPIPLVDSRGPPGGPSGAASPAQSTMQTPLSATSAARFNFNAPEFKPTAPAFNPAGSNAPSSPSSIAKGSTLSRAASPSAFFGARKPKPEGERPTVLANFQTIKKLQQDYAEALAKSKTQKPGEGPPVKDYSSIGGIVPAYLSQPRWPVTLDNEEKTYLSAFERPTTISPGVSRTSSAQAVPYHQQAPPVPGGPAMPGLHHMPPSYGHTYDEQRMHMMQPQGQPYASPSFQSRQPSSYASPMNPSAQLAYGQQPYYGGQVPMQMRQYPGAPHGQGSAPMMMQQHSSGPYMNMPQQFGGQMQPMYSPSPGHAYPQQNGYGSPGRAPMMAQQNSQQGYGQPMMYSASAQGGPMYGQQGQMNMYRGYNQPQYGSSPQQPYPQQRAGSYGQVPHHKMMHMQHGNVGQDEGK